MTRALPAALAAGALLWVVLLVAAPLTSAARFTYDIASGICHQRPERSFHLAGTPLPVCARCLGLYVSGAIAALAAFVAGGAERWSLDARQARLLFAVAALPTLATVALERLGVASPSNIVRAISALPLGGAAGWTFVRMLRAEQAVRREAGI